MESYKNESVNDRIIRLVVGLVFVFAGYYWFSGTWQVVLYILGAVSLLTSLTGFCLIYKIFGINTLSKEPKDIV